MNVLPLILTLVCFALTMWSLAMYRRSKLDKIGLVKYNMETGKVSKPDLMAIRNGELECPDCKHVGSMLAGPRGGAAQNCACGNCLSEFNIIPDHPPVIVERRGKLSVARAQIYGISPEEWKEKQR